MSQELAATRFLMEKLNAIESRLESIERMLGAPACKTCNDTGEINVPDPDMPGSEDIPCPDCSHAQKEPEWTIGAPQENKMVRVSLPGNDARWVGYITKDGWCIYSLDSPMDTVMPFRKSRKKINQWREMTKEENTLCWERGILGASEEHAELSTLELPIAKQEPEWRPMITAPSNKNIRVKRFDTGEELYACWDKGINMWVCSRTLLYPEANQFMTYEHELSGWRPL